MTIWHLLSSLHIPSCCRVHGSVSEQAASWRSIPVVHGQRLQDVKYEKAEGEGMAKVEELPYLYAHWLHLESLRCRCL